ncbi:hypothetical protein HJFPF1_08549 [Paramyrothecium foliicola]|nr:hypothetical protein HJFPF1_08549 [Paramyrothecium foliicola]
MSDGGLGQCGPDDGHPVASESRAPSPPLSEAESELSTILECPRIITPDHTSVATASVVGAERLDTLGRQIQMAPRSDAESITVPKPGSVYVIHCKGSRACIVQRKGAVLVDVARQGQCGYLWECVEKRGWLGFCNTVSGRFLGTDENLDFVAERTDLNVDECFVATYVPAGGFELRVLMGMAFWGIDVMDGRLELVECDGPEDARPAVWTFVKTDWPL